MKIEIENKEYGWMKLKFIEEKKEVFIWLSSEFDPFYNISVFMKNIRKNIDSEIVIDEEGSEKMIAATTIDKNLLSIAVKELHCNNDKVVIFNGHIDKIVFINNLKKEIIKNNIIKNNRNNWGDTFLYKIDWNKI